MISIIIPFYNEEKNIGVLVKELVKEKEKLSEELEVVLVDDGSEDKSISNIKNQISIKQNKFASWQAKIHDKNQKELIKLISHRKRLGKGKALQTGIENASGEIIGFMDGDLQDDPKDLPKFVKKIKEGYDLVNGYRKNRQDSFLIKTYSKIAGWFLKTFLHSPFNDINCPFKMFRKKVLKDFVFYGNNFRFFPLAVYYNGYKVTEIPVINHPRKFGQSKYGLTKLFGGIFDIVTAFFIYQFSEKPLHFFGPIGGGMFLVGFLISLYLTIERLFFHVLLYRRPILFLGILLMIVGIQILMTGIIGELIVYVNKKNNK